MFVYKRWQPLYQDIKVKLPQVEFVQGLPTNIDNDDFFNTNTRNMIILDDQMTATSANSKVSDLFTEGSHHRNLSVVNLTQNLFPPGKHSTTQRRNTDYFVLFKSPMGQDQVRILGKFMYPGRLQEFLSVYQSATHAMYGYLVIDATQGTAESKRLKTDIFSHDKSLKRPLPSAAAYCVEDKYHEPSRDWSKKTDEKQQISVTDSPPINNETVHTTAHSVVGSQPNNIMAISCDECGILFETLHDLQRHIRNSCPEDGPPCKRTKFNAVEILDPNPETVVSKPNTEHEVAVFQQMYDEAADLNHDEERHKIRKYMGEGMSRSDAEDKAETKMKLINMRTMINNYIDIIHNVMNLSKGLVHNEIMLRIKALTEKGFSDKEAVHLAVKEFEGQIEGLLRSHDDDESDKDSVYSDDSATTDITDSQESSESGADDDVDDVDDDDDDGDTESDAESSD